MQKSWGYFWDTKTFRHHSFTFEELFAYVVPNFNTFPFLYHHSLAWWKGIKTHAIFLIFCQCNSIFFVLGVLKFPKRLMLSILLPNLNSPVYSVLQGKETDAEKLSQSTTGATKVRYYKIFHNKCQKRNDNLHFKNDDNFENIWE